MKELTDKNYDSMVSTGYVLVDVWSETCPPCKKMLPILEEISKERSDVTIAKLCSDDYLDKALSLGVRGIPAFFLYKNGSIVAKWTGFKRKEEVCGLIDLHK